MQKMPGKVQKFSISTLNFDDIQKHTEAALARSQSTRLQEYQKKIEKLEEEIRKLVEQIENLKAKIDEINTKKIPDLEKEGFLKLHSTTIAKQTSCEFEDPEKKSNWNKERESLGTLLVSPIKEALSIYQDKKKYPDYKETRISQNYSTFSNNLSRKLRHGNGIWKLPYYDGSVGEQGFFATTVSVVHNVILTPLSKKSHYKNPKVTDQEKFKNHTIESINDTYCRLYKKK